MTSTRILERKFGTLAIQSGFATKDQINLALKAQKQMAADGQSMFLGDILVEAEVISEKQRDAVLESQKELKDKLAKTDKAEEDQKENYKESTRKIQNDSGYNLTIPGDIGIETGHVEFDGHIEVAGSVQEGYRVKGKTLTADEILQADVKMSGDIVVSKGIIGATILTDGTVKARRIRDADIDSLGDINVAAETYESRIETNGAFNIESGKILCSKVSAMRGINAAEIGSDGSVPCNLVVGFDNRIKNKIARINLEISQKEKEKEVLKLEIAELRNGEEALEDRIGELAQEEDKTIVKARSLNATLEKLKEGNDRENMTKVLQLMKHVHQELDQVKDKTGKLLEVQGQLDNRIKDRKSQIKNSAAQIQELQDDISSNIKLAKMRKNSAIVNISGTIYDRTSIQSPKARFIVKGNLQRVTIQEVKEMDALAEKKWEMIVSALK